jgi:CubicO group peptidase (beta-lactamase class C family)
MSTQLLLEKVTSLPLDELLKQGLTGPLNMTSTFFNRGNVEFSDDELIAKGIASTEYQIEVMGSIEPQRRQPVWGTVSDNQPR